MAGQSPENDDSSRDASPQFLKVCKPGTFVLHITGSGKGVFDLQAEPFPEIARAGGPLLQCNSLQKRHSADKGCASSARFLARVLGLQLGIRKSRFQSNLIFRFSTKLNKAGFRLIKGCLCAHGVENGTRDPEIPCREYVAC